MNGGTATTTYYRRPMSALWSYVKGKIGSAGSASLPVYTSGGTVTACTPSSVFGELSNSGNNISVTVAGYNRKLTVGYASNAGKLDNQYLGNIVKWGHAYPYGKDAAWYNVGTFTVTGRYNTSNGKYPGTHCSITLYVATYRDSVSSTGFDGLLRIVTWWPESDVVPSPYCYSLTWSGESGALNPDNFACTYTITDVANTSRTFNVKLWCKTSSWNSYRFVKIEEGGLTGN